MLAPMSTPGRYIAALEHFDRVWDRQARGFEDTLPDDPGSVHAVSTTPSLPVPGPPAPTFLDGSAHRTALCGVTIRVLLPRPFPPADPDGCTRCTGLAAASAVSPFLHPAERYFDRDQERRLAREEAEDLARWNEDQAERAAGPPEDIEGDADYRRRRQFRG